jgi:hypothetical protein
MEKGTCLDSRPMLTALVDVLPAALAAGIVAVLATVAVERLGGVAGGLLSSIPTTIVPAAIGIWGRNADPEEFRRAMAFVPVGIVLNMGYLVLWRVIPARLGMRTHRHLLAWTTGLALGAWFAAAAGVAALNELLQPTVAQSLVAGGVATAAGLAIAVATNRTPHAAPRGTRRVGPAVLVARGAAAAAAIGVALVLARAGLPVASGIASVFPAIFTTVMVATWIAQGAQVPTGAVGPMALGTLSVAAYALLAALLFPMLPVAGAAAACWVLSVAAVSLPAWWWLARRQTSRVSAAPAPGASRPATPQ